jgi:hypothetical protein
VIVGSSPALEFNPALAIFASLFLFAIFPFLSGYSRSVARHRLLLNPILFAPFVPFCGYSRILSVP